MFVNSEREPHASVRFLHLSIESPNVDIYINSMKVISNMQVKQVSKYLPLPRGQYFIDIYPAENQVSTILSKKITIHSGKVYTLPIIGMDNKFRMLSIEDQPNVPHGESKVRFIHLSPFTQPLDLAVVKGDVVFPKISFKNATGYLGLTPMTVNLEIREAGTKQVLFPLHNLQVKENQVYSIIAAGGIRGESSFETLMLKG